MAPIGLWSVGNSDGSIDTKVSKYLSPYILLPYYSTLKDQTSISQVRVKTFVFVPFPGSNLSWTPMRSQSTDFAHICWIVLRTRCSRRIKGFPVCPRFVLPSALHPQPRCFCWNSPSLKAPHTAFGGPSMIFFLFFVAHFLKGVHLYSSTLLICKIYNLRRHYYSWLYAFSI